MKHKKDDRKIRLLPLGGLCEIGKNITVLEYGDDLIVIDCGMAFPDESKPGIDCIIPDFTYLKNRRQHIKGLFLTHGHEDHIGAVSWFMREFECPVYGTPMTIKLAANKLGDRDKGGSKKLAQAMDRFHVVHTGETIHVGSLAVEFIRVNHSIADASALAIHTPLGFVIFSGDFKVDFTPVYGDPIDLNRFAELGNEGVLALFLESTNVEKAGVTPSETRVSETFSSIFNHVKGRIFVATFSSNVSRIQQIITAAEEHNRKFVLLGYSMNKVFEAANSLGYIDYHEESKIEVWDAKRFPDDQLVFITTGSQGEPMAALSRLAFSEHKQVNIKKGDTVILSSSAIPGNETSIYRVINELFKVGAEVIYESLGEIHVSGHAYREELRLMINLCKPKFFIPAHGEYRHLYKNAELARSQGIADDHVFLMNNGDILEFNQTEGQIMGFVEESQGVLIDSSGEGDVDNTILNQRKRLSDEGVVTCSLVVDKHKNCLAAPAQIQDLGFIYLPDKTKLLNRIKRSVQKFVENCQATGQKNLAEQLRSNQLREQLRDVLYRETKLRPMVIISVQEVF